MAILTDAMKQMIAAQQCFIGTVNSEGVPNVAPKRSTRVLDDSTLVFSEGVAKQTYANVVNGSKVAVAVVDREAMDGYRFVGTATVHHDGPVYTDVVEANAKIGRPAPKAAVTIAIEAIYSLKAGPMAGTKLA